VTWKGRTEVGTFTLSERSVDHPDSVRLLRGFHEEQVRRYGTADSIDLDPQVYAPPCGFFVVGYVDGQPAGCVGGRWSDRRLKVVELKKLFLRLEIRGRGLGGVLLRRVESWAKAQGACAAILETGVRNTAAIELFESHGFQPIASYVAGRNPAINRAFCKYFVPDRHGAELITEPSGAPTGSAQKSAT